MSTAASNGSKTSARQNALRKAVDKYNDNIRKMRKTELGITDAPDPAFVVSDVPEFGVYERIPTGIMAFDQITGGGVPRGLFTHTFGPPTGGKTTICFHFLASAQRMGLTTLFVNAEHRANREWMLKQGMDLNSTVVVNPMSLEEGLEAIVDFAPFVDAAAFDSIIAAATIGEQKKELSADKIAMLSRKLSEWFKRATPVVSRYKMAVMLVNQIRCQIGRYGAPEDAPGGNALSHYCSFKIGVRRGRVSGPDGARFKDGDTYIGYPMVCKVHKSSLGDPSLEATSDFYFSTGFDTIMDLFNLSLKQEVLVHKAAGMYELPNCEEEFDLPRGKDAVIEYIRSSPELQKYLQTSVLEAGGATYEETDEHI